METEVDPLEELRRRSFDEMKKRVEKRIEQEISLELNNPQVQKRIKDGIQAKVDAWIISGARAHELNDLNEQLVAARTLAASEKLDLQSIRENIREERSRESFSGYDANGLYLLACEIFGEQNLYWDTIDFELLGGAIKGVLGNFTERERRVTELRFGLIEGKRTDLQSVGKEFGVTRERIRQILAKVHRKMCHPSRARLVRMAVGNYEALYKVRSLMKEISEMEESLHRLIRTVKDLAVETTFRNVGITDATPVEYLSLSVRAQGCIRRDGIRTVGELCSKTEKQLLAIRGMGRTGIAEIKQELTKKGYCLLDIEARRQ